MSQPAFSDAVVEAAARKLDSIGRHHGWWPNTIPEFDQMGSIERSEFLGVVEEILGAAQDAETAERVQNSGAP